MLGWYRMPMPPSGHPHAQARGKAPARNPCPRMRKRTSRSACTYPNMMKPKQEFCGWLISFGIITLSGRKQTCATGSVKLPLARNHLDRQTGPMLPCILMSGMILSFLGGPKKTTLEQVPKGSKRMKWGSISPPRHHI